MHPIRHCLAGLLAVAIVAHAAGALAFPLHIMGSTLEVTPDSKQVDLAKALRGLLPSEHPSLDNPARLQYDYIAVEGQGPLCLLFDFDGKGRLSRVLVEANMQVQNPVARDLVAWLRQNAGPGRKIKHGLAWTREGFAFSFTEVRDAGEDSNYGVEITRK